MEILTPLGVPVVHAALRHKQKAGKKKRTRGVQSDRHRRGVK